MCDYSLYIKSVRGRWEKGFLCLSCKMSTGRRLAKRSILGTRVSAPGQDGRYYPCIIQASKTIAKSGDNVDSNGHVDGENMYSVVFEDQRTSELKENEIVGPGFQNISCLKLKPGQKVYVTHNGREVSGSVICHWPHIDEVQIRATVNTDELIDLKKKLEEVRLLESRKSARLHDQDQDYSRLADGGGASTAVETVNRKRQTSHVIDVPTPQSNRKRRPSSPDDTDIMDDCAAAMVLMSLSCSPKSPRLPNYNFDAGLHLSHSWTEFSYPQSPVSSSGASSWNSVKSQQSGPRTPSPPTFMYGLSESAPASFAAMRFNTVLRDEGIDVCDGIYGIGSDDFLPRKRRNSTKTLFRCTWPGCDRTASACAAIEKHVRNAHLGPRGKENSDDHEEEFYYTEIETDMDSFVENFTNIFTSSPPTQSHMDMARPPHEDPECQKQVQTSPQKVIRLSPKSLSSTVKPMGLHRKSRGDSKKCRKVYGMENRESWCTQCKWKKACTRFID